MSRLVVLAALLTACSDGAPRVSPSVMQVDAQGPLRIEGLSPDDFLAVRDDRVSLVADYRVELGETATSIVSAEPSGVTVTTDTPLAVGSYALVVHANGRVWRVEDALAVVGSDAVDAAADARVCPDAPAGCTPFACPTSGSCYYVCGARAYSAAKAGCSTRGLGCLATIDDAAENDCIAAATQPAFPDLVWIGYEQADSSPEPAGGWSWVCESSSFVAPNWGQFEPNDQNGEDCGAMSAGGAWIDGGCETSLRYVCELP